MTRRWPLLLVLIVVTGCGGSSTAGSGGEDRASTVGEPGEVPSPSPTATDEPRGALDGRVVLVDPGHNGRNGANPEQINRTVEAGGLRKACDTAGASTNAGYTEAAYTWDVSRRLARRLRAEGARVVLTRASNDGVGPCIDRRAALGNRARADAAISVHADGGPPDGRGFHVILPRRGFARTRPIYAASRRLALDVRAALDGIGVRRADYIGSAGLSERSDLGGLNLSTVPKVFVETGNMRNAADARLLSSPAWRGELAQALADGVIEFLGEEGG